MKKSRDCFCALCRSPRKLRYNRHLSRQNFTQIAVLTIVVAAIAYPWLSFKGLMSLPLVWAIFESTHKSLYRKDLKCPYCGFDPTWYKKDVNLARQKVEQFLKENPDSPLLVRAQREELFRKQQ
jgi:hypothetical protein